MIDYPIARDGTDTKEQPPASQHRQMDRPIRFVVYGGHSASWNDALAPSAPVWALVDGVAEVVVVSDPAQPLPAARDNIRTIVLPIMEQHLLACPRDRHEGLMPTPEMVGTLADKAAFAAYVARQGLASFCPRVFPSAAEAQFPCVVKRVNLNAGKGVEIAATAEHLGELLRTKPWKGFPLLLQAYEPQPHEYVTHAVCRDGRIVLHRTYRFTLKPDVRIRRPGSTRSCERWSPSPQQLETLESFLRPLRYNGPCNFDYGIRPDGTVCVFEINPRLGGSLMARVNVREFADLLGAIARHARPLADVA